MKSLRILVALAALALVAGGAAGAPDQAATPDLSLVTLAGRPVSLAAALDGRPTVLNLWATWCPPCREEMPMLAASQQRETALRFVFVNQGEVASVVQRYLDDEIMTLDNLLLDTGSKLGPAFGARGLPTTLFFDRQGRLLDRHAGALSRSELESRLEVLRANASAMRRR